MKIGGIGDRVFMQSGKLEGVIVASKPVGISSYAVVNYVKRVLAPNQKSRGANRLKVGHLGTLDPLACGVLVILVGKNYTKKNQELSAGTKTYRAIFSFTKQTSTGDTEGEVIKTSSVLPTKDQVLKALFTGKVMQTVPKFSAVHINGERAYDLARRGVDFTPPTKEVEIFRFELLAQLNIYDYFFEIECSTGTYVRALAEMLAERLNTVAHTRLIIRTKVANFDIKNAVNYRSITKNSLQLIYG
ncbi:MAG: tRNA pseudouridine(55) synthase TruB [Firmicutes bacterium]|nr:tRNA pseudouridine(55) synthase TruB [Bacillota bacterium]